MLPIMIEMLDKMHAELLSVVGLEIDIFDDYLYVKERMLSLLWILILATWCHKSMLAKKMRLVNEAHDHWNAPERKCSEHPMDDYYKKIIRGDWEGVI